MRRRLVGPGLLLLALLPVLFYVGAERTLLGGETGFPLDDSWIHLRFAANLADGVGLSYHPGEPVSGSTAPLWTALLALLAILPVSAVTSAKVAGVVLHLAVVATTRRLALEIGLGSGASALAAVLVLGTSWLVWGALSGMEIPLFTLLALWGLLLHLREREDERRLPVSPILFAVATLARPEGLLLLLLALCDRLVRWERNGVWRARLGDLRSIGLGSLGAALVLLPAGWALYRIGGGTLLPTTFAVKAGEGLGLPQGRFLYVAAGIFARAQPWVVLFAGAGALRLLRDLGTPRDRGLLPVAWVLALPFAYGVLTPPGRELVGNFGRYLFPLFPPLVVLGVVGLQGFGELLERPLRLGRWRLPLRPLALVVLFVPTVLALVAGAGLYARAVANVNDSDVRLARWLAPRLPADAVLAVQDIGAVGYLLPNRLVDLAGIVTPEVRGAVLRSIGPEDPEGDEGMWRFLAERRPDYLAVWPRWHPRLTGNRARLRPVVELPLDHNVAMAGDRLTLYATPWTRYPLAPIPTQKESP